MLLTSSLDGTSLPVPGTRRKLKLLALLTLPLPTPHPPALLGSPWALQEEGRIKTKGFSLKPCPAPHLQPPTPHEGICLPSCSPFPDRSSSFYALQEKSERVHPTLRIGKPSPRWVLGFTQGRSAPESRKPHFHLWAQKAQSPARACGRAGATFCSRRRLFASCQSWWLRKSPPCSGHMATTESTLKRPGRGGHLAGQSLFPLKKEARLGSWGAVSTGG